MVSPRCLSFAAILLTASTISARAVDEIRTQMAPAHRPPCSARPTQLTQRVRAGHHRGRNRTLRDSMLVLQLVFLPRAVIAGNAAIFSPRWTMKAS